MPTPRDLLNEAKASIREVDQPDAQALLEGGGVTFLDVREPDEYEQGAIPSAVHLPRGHLEFQVEGKLPDKAGPIVVYCAGGCARPSPPRPWATSATPTCSRSIGGFNKWKDDGRPWAAPQTLTPAQRNRYQRHLLLPEVGEVGQLKLLGSKVLLLGAGGLGLTGRPLPGRRRRRARSGIIDMDVVDESNLQRQILHNMDRVGDRKVDSAKKTLTALNPDVNVVTYDVRLGADNILDIIDGYDVIVDGTDNFPTRYLVNDASLLKRIPVVHGSIFRFEGQATVFDPYNGPCYRCLIPEPPPAELAPSCAEAGVLGVLPGIIGRSRPSRPSRCCSASATRWSAGCSPTTRWRSRSARSRCAATRRARPAGPTPARSSSPSTTISACRTRTERPRGRALSGVRRLSARPRPTCSTRPRPRLRRHRRRPPGPPADLPAGQAQPALWGWPGSWSLALSSSLVSTHGGGHPSAAGQSHGGAGHHHRAATAPRGQPAPRPGLGG